MTKDPERLAGWTIREATRRTVDRRLLARCASSIREWRKAGSPSRFTWLSAYMNGGEDLNDSTRALKRLFEQQDASAKGVASSFRHHLFHGRLVAWGRLGSPVAELKPIPSTAWNHLRIKDSRASVVTEHTAGKSPIFNVRIYPVIEAPDAVDHLANKPIAEVLERWVFGDPQLVALSEHAKAAGATPLEPSIQRRLYSTLWPVSCGQGDWQSQLKYIHPRHTPRSLPADLMLGKRYARLIDYLKSGELLAEGVNAQGQVVAIPRSLWTREQTLIDIRNGDLVECMENVKESENFYSNPIFMGVMLRMFHVNARSSDRVRSSTTKIPRKLRSAPSAKRRKQRPPTAHEESTRAAIEALWGGKIPRGVLVKQIHEQIIGWQRLNGQVVASTRTLHRYTDKKR